MFNDRQLSSEQKRTTTTTKIDRFIERKKKKEGKKQKFQKLYCVSLHVEAFTPTPT